MFYHSLFGSQFQYEAHLWEQANTKNQKQVQLLQNKAVKKICFKKQFDFTDSLYTKLNILKFKDMVHLQNYLFMSQVGHNKKLAETFPALK